MSIESGEGYKPPGAEEWKAPDTGSTTESANNGAENLKQTLESINDPLFYRQRALNTVKELSVGEVTRESGELGKDLYYQ